MANLKTPRGINRRGMLSLSLGAAIAPGLITRPAIAQTKTTILRFGGSQPLTTNYGQAMVKLGEELARRSEGRLTVQVFPSGQLGGLKDMVTAVQLGTQSMVMVTPTWIANYAKQLDILSLLYFSRSQDKLFEALDGPFGTKLAAFAEPVGFKILGWWNSGPRHILNNVRPINTPDDVKGLKLRSQTSPIWLQSLRALGANPVSLDYPEIYLALQQGTFDGYENPAPDVVGGKFYEVAKYMSLTSHLFDIFLVAINKRQWDRLSSADKQAMEESMAVATKWQREAEADEVKQALDLLRTKMRVNDISDADRQLFAERVRPGYQDFAKLVGEDFFAEASRALS